jgi:elongation factor 1-alpha
MDVTNIKANSSIERLQSQLSSISLEPDYKLTLSKHIINNFKEKLYNQIQFRLEEGGGECFYEIGLTDSRNRTQSEEEVKESLEELEKIVTRLDASLQIVNMGGYRETGIGAEVMIRKNGSSSEKMEIKAGLFGDESCGKSTLVGVLVNGQLDNGEGSAKANMFRYKHELQSGKTSSINHQVIIKFTPFRLLDLINRASL